MAAWRMVHVRMHACTHALLPSCPHPHIRAHARPPANLPARTHAPRACPHPYPPARMHSPIQTRTCARTLASAQPRGRGRSLQCYELPHDPTPLRMRAHRHTAAARLTLEYWQRGYLHSAALQLRACS
eukprot:350434-Chlamydomonas_euryale.AAC.2